jgi:hypothetical protein
MLLNTRTYNRHRGLPDSVFYAGPAHTFSNHDLVELKRSEPKPTKDNPGVAKPLFRVNRTVPTGTDASGLAIMTLQASLPVGMASADIDALLADLAAWAASNEAKAHFKSLDIEQ